ncbi:MAG: acetyltransferase [Gemmatimonadales bacterium]
MTRTPLVIVGASGFGREVAALVADLEAAQPGWDLLGFLDDEPDAPAEVGGVPVLGGLNWLAARPGQIQVAIGIGSPRIKRLVVARLRDLAAGFPVLIHPGVVRGRNVEFGPGSLVCAGNILTVDIRAGAFLTLNLACTVGHDSRFGDFTTLAPGANISGNVTLGEGCDIGTGSALIQGVTVGEWSIVGAGAVVTRDLPANCTAVGVPAEPVKRRSAGWHEVHG